MNNFGSIFFSKAIEIIFSIGKNGVRQQLTTESIAFGAK